MKRAVFIALLAGLVVLSASGAYADTVGLALAANGGPILISALSPTGSFVLPPTPAAGWLISATVVGSPGAGPEPNLEGFTVDASDTSLGLSSVQIYVTEIGLSSPTGIANFISGFTSNLIFGGIATVTESTYVDAGNTPFATTSLLDSFTFTGPISLAQSQTFSALTPSLSPLFSETEVFNIAATGIGSTSDTISITSSPVPEPGTLAMFGTGLIGLAGLVRRKLLGA